MAKDEDVSSDDIMIDTPDGPMTFAQWKKKHPVQVPSRRTKGKDLPVKVKRFTEPSQTTPAKPERRTPPKRET